MVITVLAALVQLRNRLLKRKSNLWQRVIYWVRSKNSQTHRRFCSSAAMTLPPPLVSILSNQQMAMPRSRTSPWAAPQETETSIRSSHHRCTLPVSTISMRLWVLLGLAQRVSRSNCLQAEAPISRSTRCRRVQWRDSYSRVKKWIMTRPSLKRHCGSSLNLELNSTKWNNHHNPYSASNRSSHNPNSSSNFNFNFNLLVCLYRNHNLPTLKARSSYNPSSHSHSNLRRNRRDRMKSPERQSKSWKARVLRAQVKQTVGIPATPKKATRLRWSKEQQSARKPCRRMICSSHESNRSWVAPPIPPPIRFSHRLNPVSSSPPTELPNQSWHNKDQSSD